MANMMQKKVTVVGYKSAVDASYEFRVAETVNYVDFLPGDRVSAEQMRILIHIGVNVVVKRKVR